MFFNGSRYLRIKEAQVPGPDGAPRTIKRVRPLARLREAFTQKVKQGDRLDLLAFSVYRASRKWWLIADANPQVLHPDELLAPGRVLNVPRDEAR
jgi:nucleoid-associated protein YgaU